MLKIIFALTIFLSSVFGGLFGYYVKPNGDRAEGGAAYTTCFRMPFYDLRPKELSVRAKFYTSYGASSEERKFNIALAVKSINDTIVDVGGEFSFNGVVGERTEKRGYKKAKIIMGGKFVDGVGGGVCQVSTTLYNAVLLAGLKVTEYHSHSLPVSYVVPSFDAMVNSGSADFRFVNDTHNPIIIKAYANDTTLTVRIFGEPMREVLIRKSVITEYIPVPKSEIIVDTAGEYPDLFLGERKILSYGKCGYKSEGYIIKKIDGKTVSVEKIRNDSYAATRGIVVEGTAIRSSADTETEENSLN